jgi:hypothetical protein
MILASQVPADQLAPINPSPPTGSSPSGIRPSADLVEADASLETSALDAIRAVAASPLVSPSDEEFSFDLRPVPKAVESAPHLLASTLQISSHPVGAQVYVDGLPSGKTPLDMELTLGKHEVRLALPDFYDWKAQIEIIETNQAIPLYFRLLPVE